MMFSSMAKKYGLSGIVPMTVLLLGAAAGCFNGAGSIDGAGATFPYTVYSRWTHRYNQETGVRVNYLPIGSGGGLAQIVTGTVDFGAVDIPLHRDELDEHGLLQFPMVMGGIVPVHNIHEVGDATIRLTPSLLAAIFLGEIETWDHPAIADANPDIILPDHQITVVHRSEGSGTTWIFTNYLSRVSERWRDTVGSSKSVQWPVGIAGKGNKGVAVYVQSIHCSIGYVEYSYAFQNDMNVVALQNREGVFVEPSSESFSAAAENADWDNKNGYYMVLTDQPGVDSWPITGATFILLYREQDSAETARTMLDFFDWCYTEGHEIASEMNYVPMPQNVVNLVRETWRTEVTVAGEPAWGFADSTTAP